MKTETKPYPKVINNLQYNYKDNQGEINNEPSETVPNQSFTVGEVLLRFSNGTLPNIVQPVYYDDNDDFDNVDITQDPAFDLVDAENYKNYLATKKESEQKTKTNLSQSESQKNEPTEQKSDENSEAAKTSE